MTPKGVEIFIAIELVGVRLGFERLGALVRERMGREPGSRTSLFVFFGRRGHSVKVLWWDGTGVILGYKRLDSGVFETPKAAREGDRSVVVSETPFEAIFAGLRRLIH